MFLNIKTNLFRLTMNILFSSNFSQKSNNNVSFKGQNLFPTVVKKTLLTMENVPLSTHFARLDKSDAFELYSQRSDLARSEYGLFILRDLIRNLQKKDWNTDFFKIEAPTEKSPYRKTKGLASIYNGPNYTEVINLQTLKEYDDSIRGVGARLLYGICKLADVKGHTHIKLSAAGEHLFDFYKNLGFKQSKDYKFDFYLTDQEYERFLKNIDEKYSIKAICAQN